MSTEPKPVKTNTEARRAPRAIPRSLARLADSARNVWRVQAPDNLELCQLEDPTAWAAQLEMRRGDIIEVLQNHRFSTLFVHDYGPGYLGVRVLSTLEIPERGEDRSSVLPQGYEIRRARVEDAVIGDWTILRTADGHILNQHERHERYEDARRFLLDHAVIRESGGKGKSYPGRG